MTEVEFNTKNIFAEFDYTPWQRINSKAESSSNNQTRSNNHYQRDYSPKCTTIVRKLSVPPIHLKESLSSTTSSPIPQSQKAISQTDFGKECSLLCRHGRPKSNALEVIKKERRFSKDGAIALLKIQIKERKNSLEECKARFLKLIRNNVEIKEELTLYEKSKFSDATLLMDKFEKFQDALAVIDVEHEKIYSREKKEYESMKKIRKNTLDSLCEEEKYLDIQIKEQKLVINSLLNYKEKEYPEKAEQIKSLEEDISRLMDENINIISNLHNIVSIHSADYQKRYTEETEELKHNIAMEALSSLDQSVRNVAKHNDVLKKEVSEHQKEIKNQKEKINILKKEILCLKGLQREDMNQVRYPFSYMQKVQ